MNVNTLFDFVGAHIYECIALVGFVVSLIFNLIMYARTRDIKYLKDGILLMKYKTENYVGEKTKGQSFSNLKPVYRLNKSTGALELTDEYIDIQAEIDSMRDYCLQACLERFEAQYSDDVSEAQNQYDTIIDDIDNVNQIFNIAEQYRDQLGLSDELSIGEVFSAMQKKSGELKSYIQSQNDKKKGVSVDETKTQE